MKKITSVCDGCVFAEWRKNAAGRRTGEGLCAYELPDIPIPRAKYHLSFVNGSLKQSIRLGGGHITLKLTPEEVERKPNTCPVREQHE